MPRSRARRVAAGVDELAPADDFGAHEALLDVGVDLAGRVPRGEAVAQMPGLRRLGLAGGEEGDQAQQREGLAHDAREPGLADAELVAHRGGVLVLELGELGLDARGHGHGARAL